VGFLDYAWVASLQKDDTKLKILLEETLCQPTLELDDFGFTIRIPTPHLLETGQISFLGYSFPSNASGKSKLGRLFRGSISHLTAHTLAPFPKEEITPNKSDPIVVAFARSLINDMYVSAYIQARNPEKIMDIAYANALAYQKIKPSNRIFTVSTRLMTSLLLQLNLGITKGVLDPDQTQAMNHMAKELTALRQTFLESISDQKANHNEIVKKEIENMEQMLASFGPFLEAPSLRHTENIGRCSIYSETESSPEFDFESLFRKSVETLGGTIPPADSIEEYWSPEQETEALQAFNSNIYQKQKEEKILNKIIPYVSATKFRSVSFPEEDYTQYLRARGLVQGASRRLLDILRSAFNYLDEDPRQEMGQLDLASVIQSLASNKPATDVFTLDEYLKPSFAWSILFDVSNSMQVKGEYGRALAIAVAEAAKELMTDPTSWTFFGFSDRLHIIKDSSESYSKKIRARIGGLKFNGLTYIPDAVQIAGKMLAKRFEEQRCLIVISDGWPHGYENMSTTLKECIENLLRRGVIVLGIGVETELMSKFFHLHTSIYEQKDLVNKFGSNYMNASAKALET